jgi:hypothetical protein
MKRFSFLFQSIQLFDEYIFFQKIFLAFVMMSKDLFSETWPDICNHVFPWVWVSVGSVSKTQKNPKSPIPQKLNPTQTQAKMWVQNL